MSQKQPGKAAQKVFGTTSVPLYIRALFMAHCTAERLALQRSRTTCKNNYIVNQISRGGAPTPEITGLKDKRMITAVFCGTLCGDFLPLQLVYQGKTERCHPKYNSP